MKLLGTIAAAAAFCVAGASAPAFAQTKTIYIGMNGGPMEKAYTSQVLPDFEKANGVKVVVVPGTSSDVLAKLLANRNKPQIHVAFLDDGVMARAVSLGVCQKLDDSPVLKELYPFARMKDDMGAGVQLGMTGIAYNKKLFTEKGWAAPTSWMDFADPKYKGKVVFQSASSSTFGLHGFLAINRLLGGSEQNVEPAFSKWATTVGPNVVEYIPNSAKISEMVQTGEAGLFPLTPTAVSDLQDKGIPVAYANPKEGPVLLLVDLCVVANNPDPQLAQKLAQFLLSAPAQAKAAEAGKQIPTNRQARMPPAMQQSLGNIDDLVRKATVVDWTAINARRAQWDTRWNRQIEQ
ncbi:ABC transporter substrate-binding protein [Trinickia caryophylli]|uniref:Putative spermidine/putrescine transport system substrate-binding protein n=1 Tax=Trinickia caryophylli TaxID=28094 RepID=A0A1X7FUJ1_TRICW|nr:ABC transporter substrate-binding protein [Trinickia caryophylli]PMS11852.1 ABC transporter substrate-binding protein [Trinickia caryophylli]TRX14073.1 ABC transporter substrate-binding protein [Trinickia caryophylli]WQE13891.1 ABC transporter substrate-binding protein [Trinickia caryophylli]SMF58995.1 putative spermidine/putrescine transport system substrate-binding protein [Trinickia caryophylli]GLU33558.1 spermidine/putrescine ABC transporter substrate-binding protein [Trinickia caryophy